MPRAGCKDGIEVISRVCPQGEWYGDCGPILNMGCGNGALKAAASMLNWAKLALSGQQKANSAKGLRE